MEPQRDPNGADTSEKPAPPVVKIAKWIFCPKRSNGFVVQKDQMDPRGSHNLENKSELSVSAAQKKGPQCDLSLPSIYFYYSDLIETPSCQPP